MNQSFNKQPIQKWSEKTLIQWIKSLHSIAEAGKNKIIEGIKSFKATGSDVIDVDKEDLAESLEISIMLAGQLFQAIDRLRDTEFRYRQPGAATYVIEGDDTFSINLQGEKGRLQKIAKLKPSYTVRYLKEKYLESYGKNINNKDVFKEVRIRKLNTILEDHRTLKSYGIINDKIILHVAFRVNGGSALQNLQWLFFNHNVETDEKKSQHDEKKSVEKEEKKFEKSQYDDDECRTRKLRSKKYKQIILSNEPDCLMGYTNEDGIKRAKMPCGCSFAADTMYRFMKAAFDQESNYRAITMKCPMPKKQCKGTVKDRKWDWSLVFIIADLSEKEIVKYNQIISNRIDGIKLCPHCEVNCERPKDLTKFRVNCPHCKKPDWCWECRKVWKGDGSVVCGNGNCIAERLNQILKNANMINPKVNENCDWASKIGVPDIRHCPKCLTIIEYIKNCRHMKCSGCPHEFCFKCLANWKGHVSSKCVNVAPIQQIKDQI